MGKSWQYHQLIKEEKKKQQHHLWKESKMLYNSTLFLGNLDYYDIGDPEKTLISRPWERKKLTCFQSQSLSGEASRLDSSSWQFAIQKFGFFTPLECYLKVTMKFFILKKNYSCSRMKHLYGRSLAAQTLVFFENNSYESIQ